MSDNLILLQGDAATELMKLGAESVDLVVTSPPYDNLRTYGSGQSFNFEEVACAIEAVLKPGGIICWNVADAVVDGSETLTSFKQAIFFKDKLGLRVHDTMIYEKSNGSKPDDLRYMNCMEYIFILTKGRPNTFNGIRDKKNVTAGKPCFGLHTMREKDGEMTVRKDRKIAAEYGLRTNVWKGNTRGQEDMGKELKHPAMMPKWLAHDLILSFSNPGDVVLDPMAGSGTVPAQAISLGRKAIAVDRNADYVALIRETVQKVTPGLAI
jgi:DNA modification methylase